MVQHTLFHSPLMSNLSPQLPHFIHPNMPNFNAGAVQNDFTQAWHNTQQHMEQLQHQLQGLQTDTLTIAAHPANPTLAPTASLPKRKLSDNQPAAHLHPSKKHSLSTQDTQAVHAQPAVAQTYEADFGTPDKLNFHTEFNDFQDKWNELNQKHLDCLKRSPFLQTSPFQAELNLVHQEQESFLSKYRGIFSNEELKGKIEDLKAPIKASFLTKYNQLANSGELNASFFQKYADALQTGQIKPQKLPELFRQKLKWEINPVQDYWNSLNQKHAAFLERNPFKTNPFQAELNLLKQDKESFLSKYSGLFTKEDLEGPINDSFREKYNHLAQSGQLADPFFKKYTDAFHTGQITPQKLPERFRQELKWEISPLQNIWDSVNQEHVDFFKKYLHAGPFTMADLTGPMSYSFRFKYYNLAQSGGLDKRFTQKYDALLSEGKLTPEFIAERFRQELKWVAAMYKQDSTIVTQPWNAALYEQYMSNRYPGIPLEKEVSTQEATPIQEVVPVQETAPLQPHKQFIT